MCWQSSATRDYNIEVIPTNALIENAHLHINDFNFFFGVHLLELNNNNAPITIGLSEGYILYNLEG